MRARTIRGIGRARSRLVVVVGWKHAGVNPAASRGRAVVLEVFEVRDLLALRPRVPIDLLQDLLDDRLLVRSSRWVIPGEPFDRLVLRIETVGVQLLQSTAEVIEEP